MTQFDYRENETAGEVFEQTVFKMKFLRNTFACIYTLAFITQLTCIVLLFSLDIINIIPCNHRLVTIFDFTLHCCEFRHF